MRIALVSSFALALVACSPPAANQSGDSTPATQSASVTPSTAAGAPAVRLGRWSKVINVMGRTMTEVECVTTEDLNQMAADPNSHCTSANGFQRSAEGLVYEAECTGEDGGGHLRTVLSGDMQNHYVADMTMSGTGVPNGMQIHVEGTYEGACRGDE